MKKPTISCWRPHDNSPIFCSFGGIHKISCYLPQPHLLDCKVHPVFYLTIQYKHNKNITYLEISFHATEQYSEHYSDLCHWQSKTNSMRHMESIQNMERPIKLCQIQHESSLTFSSTCEIFMPCTRCTFCLPSLEKEQPGMPTNSHSIPKGPKQRSRTKPWPSQYSAARLEWHPWELPKLSM